MTSLVSHFISLIILLDKMTSVNKRDANQQVRIVADQIERRQDVSVGASNSPLTVISTVPQPKTDATDRRHIEAQNEDKAHTTKETLDDIKRVHQKEKKKKEEQDNVIYQTRTVSEGGVRKAFIYQIELCFPI